MTQNTTRVRDNPALVRDNASGAILNTDIDSFMARRLHKQNATRAKNNDARLAELEIRVEKLESIIERLLENGGRY